MIRICILILTLFCTSSFLASAYADNSSFSAQQQFGMTFEQIQSAAAQGDPDAEYALGYMLYYGKGAPRDEQTARMWIEKAAAQGQPQAIKALQMLAPSSLPKEGGVQPKGQNGQPDSSANANLTPAIGNKTDSLPQNNVGPSSTPTNTMPSSATPVMNGPADSPGAGAPPETTGTVHLRSSSEKNDESFTLSERKLLKAPASYYTLQLLGAYEKSDLAKFLEKHPSLRKDAVYFRSTPFHGRTWYILVYGIYPSDSAAQAAIKHLPESVRKLNPWVKSMRAVHEELRSVH